MEVILTQEVKKLGKPGERIRVKDGYARNFLIPNLLALETTPQNLASQQQQQKKEQARRQRQQQQAEELARRISELSCTIAVETGQQDRLFGTVTAADIAAAVSQKSGMTLDKHSIELAEPIKQLGVYTIPVRLHPKIKAQLKLWVIKK